MDKTPFFSQVGLSFVTNIPLLPVTAGIPAFVFT
jgi:hypothetical protein